MAEARRARHVVIAGGGTGGHLFPGVAVVEAIQEIDPSIRVTFVGAERGIEARVVPALGYDLRLVDVVSLKGSRGAALMRGVGRLPGSALASRKLVKELKPDIVISVGGYAAGPFTMMAGLHGVPVALMEQNARPGVTNRILGKVAKVAFLTFEEGRAFFPGLRCEVTGNPVRRSILELAQTFTYQAPTPDGPFRILVIGGSGGAGSLNEHVPRLCQAMGIEEQKRLRVRHQAGRDRGHDVIPRYEGFVGGFEVVDFIDDMAEAYRWCDLLVCRAGASTIAEVLTLGIPAIYVPFPGAADQHQEKNALSIVEAGAGMMLPDDEISSDRAQRLLTGLMTHSNSLNNIAIQARGLARPEAAHEIAEQVLELIT